MPLSVDSNPIHFTQADLEGRLLRYFLAVIREGSIRAAAESLNVAPSAVSRQISDLEQRLGLPLLERLPRGVVPTEAGLAIAEHARQQMEDADRLINYLHQLHGLRQSALRIMCGEGFVADLFDEAVRPFMETYPHMRIQVLLGATPDILEAVAESRVDVGLAYNPPPRIGVRSIAIARQQLCAVVASHHPIAGSEKLALADLASTPLAMTPRHHGLRDLVESVEAEQGLHLVPAFESGSIDLLRRFALSGMGATLLPEFAAATELAARRLVAIPLVDPVLVEASAHLLIRAQRRLPRNLERLVSTLTTGMRAFRPEIARGHQGSTST
jgi:DNA-binding transcriptional LysR family regulator